MFDISWTELMVIGVVALIAIGPKELPGVLRTVGQWAGKARRMAGEFQGQFREAMREAEMAELKKSFDEVKSATTAFTDNNPLTSLQKDVDAALNGTPSASSPAASLLPPAVPAPEPADSETLAAAEAHAIESTVTAPLAILPPVATPMVADQVAAVTAPADSAAAQAGPQVPQDQAAQDRGVQAQAAQDQVVQDQVAKDQKAS